LLQSRNSNDSVSEEEASKINSNDFGVYTHEQDGSRNTMDEDDNYQTQYENAFAPRNRNGSYNVSAVNNDEGVDEFETNVVTKGGNVVKGMNHHSDEAAQHKCSSETTVKGSAKAKKPSHTSKAKFSKSPKSTSKTSIDFCDPEIEKKGKIPDEPS